MFEKCMHCQFWVPYRKEKERWQQWMAMTKEQKAQLPPGFQGEPSITGTCHRHAPIHFANDEGASYPAVWIETDGTDGCGDFE